MVMYATKVWGFDPADWPLVTFSREGTRNRLRGLWQPGDTMLCVGTQAEPTFLHERGKMLGYVEFTSIPVATRDVVDPAMLRKSGDKWPFALLAVRAWRILDPPVFKAFLPELAARAPGMILASGFEALTGEEEARVRALEVAEETVPLTPAGERAAAKTDLVAWLKRRRGPVPASGSVHTSKRPSQAAKTYLLKWASRGLMKIGWAVDPDARALHLSEPLVPEFTGERWQIVRTQDWDDEYGAYLMEQAFVDRLMRHGIKRSGEYFRSPAKAGLVEVTLWAEAMADAHAAYRRRSDTS